MAPGAREGPPDFPTTAFTIGRRSLHTRDVKLRRFIITLYLVLFVSLAAGAAGFFWQTRAEYNRLKDMEAASRSRLALAEERLRDQQRMLERLRSDPAYVEMVIRRRMGYAKPDEFIFRFEP
jgi:cell division protein DivIC